MFLGRRNRSVVFLVVFSLVNACGGSSESGTNPTPPPPAAPLTITAGNNQSDTIQTTFNQALTVDVRVSGAAKSGVSVRFDALSNGANSAFVSLASLTSNTYG